MYASVRATSKYLIAFVVLSICFLMIARTVSARMWEEGNILASSKVIEGDFITAGETVTISGTVNGDVYVAGGAVTIDGIVSGDVLVAGGTVNIFGDVGQDVRVVGGTIVVDGRIDRNLSVLGGTVTIGEDTVVGGNTVGMYGNLAYRGNTNGSLRLMGGDTTIAGMAGGMVDVRTGTLLVAETARIGGDLSYQSPEEAVLQPGSSVSGEISYTQVQDTHMGSKLSTNVMPVWQHVHRGISIVEFFLFAIIGYGALRLFPKRMLRMSDQIIKRPLPTLAMGILACVVVPILGVLFFITIIGIPFGFLIFFIFAALLFMAKLWVSFAIGRVIFRKLEGKERGGWALIAGLLIFFIVANLPGIGWLVRALTYFLGIGALVIERKRFYDLLSEKHLV